MRKRALVPWLALLAVLAIGFAVAPAAEAAPCTGAFASACKIKIEGHWYIRFRIKIGCGQGTVHGSASWPLPGGQEGSSSADGVNGARCTFVYAAPPSGSTPVTASAEGYNSQNQRVCGPNEFQAITMNSLNVCNP